MNKKFLITKRNTQSLFYTPSNLLIIIFLTCNFLLITSNSFAETCKDVVDLNQEHWAYKSSIKAIEKYKLFSCFNDHTFRGNKKVSLEEFSTIILNFLHYIEEEKGISLKLKTKQPFQESFFDKIPKSKYNSAINELKDSYGIFIAFYDEKYFDPERDLDIYDVIFTLNKIIDSFSKGFDNKNKNPFNSIQEETKIDILGKKDFPEKLIKNILKTEIINSSAINSEQVISRYRISVIFDKLFDYLVIYEQLK
ncbi:MAG: hypothetical protein U0457_17365 [Candidatus Sericytochromatia bacterium]